MYNILFIHHALDWEQRNLVSQFGYTDDHISEAIIRCTEKDVKSIIAYLAKGNSKF